MELSLSASSEPVDINKLLDRENLEENTSYTGNEVSQPEQIKKRKEEKAQRRRNSSASLRESTGFRVTMYVTFAIVVAIIVFLALLFGTGMQSVFWENMQQPKTVSADQSEPPEHEETTPTPAETQEQLAEPNLELQQ